MAATATHETITRLLLGCIEQHGPITEKNVGSAAKRLTGQLAGLDTESYWHRRYERLKHGLNYNGTRASG